MPWTILARPARTGRIRSCSLIASVALFAALAAMSVVLPASTAQACGITRQIHNKTDQGIYVEIWRGGARAWISPDPIKPGGSLKLEYVHLGDSLYLSAPNPAHEWQKNALGVILELHRCKQFRLSGESKLGRYKVSVSPAANADILVSGPR
jgi:hypothetical protein